jgi:hypothetical protein
MKFSAATLGREHAGQRLAVRAALADHHDDLALASLVLPQPTIPAILATVRRAHIAAEIAAIHFRPLANTADRGLPHFRCQRLAQLVRQNERGLVGRAEIAAERQHALAFDLVDEDRDCHQVRPQRQLAASEQRAAGQTEILLARLALVAQCVSPAADVDRGAAAFRAVRLSAVVSPSEPGEHSLDLRIAQPDDRPEGQRLGGWREEEVLRHVYGSDNKMTEP